jgi:polyhydroxyalkanoate synthesis regulator phasin
MSTARDRAEELLANLQKRAKDLLSAEEGLVRTVRDLIENAGWTPEEVRKRLEELVGRIKANKVWERLNVSGKLVALGDYRDEVERRAQQLLGNLPVVSKQEVQELSDRVASLEQKLEKLAAKG